MDVFEKHNLQKKSVDEIADIKEIQKLNITNEWLRIQLDYLSSKTFLIKDRERRIDEAGKIISKPVFIYSYNKLQRLEIPEWKDLDKFSSNTTNSYNTSNSSNSSNRGVNEVIEVNEPKSPIEDYKVTEERITDG